MMIKIGDQPLASVATGGIRPLEHPSSATSCPLTRPLVLRGLQAAPTREVPEYVYDSYRQIATNPSGAPLAPILAKEWTSHESTHTDGDGGDNETWGWEESAPAS